MLGLTHVLDRGYVQLLDITDPSIIVKAARMSTTQDSKGAEADAKLVQYLAKHKHTSPFEMVSLWWKVKAPIFVARQWMRHRMGSFNEKSLRYIEEDTPEFYQPLQWRYQAKTNRQSSEGAILDDENINDSYYLALTQCVQTYHDLIAQGVAREMARMVLPVSLYTEFMWKTDLHNFMRFVALRSKSNAQWEIQQYSNAMVELVTPYFDVKGLNYHDS